MINFMVLGRKPKLHNWASYFERTKSQGAPLRLFKEVCNYSEWRLSLYYLTRDPFDDFKFTGRKCFKIGYIFAAKMICLNLSHRLF